jgi:dipeptidyl-peptidase-3
MHSFSDSDARPYLIERVDNVAVVQLYADGFERLSLREKLLIWHLYEAALAGRDIYYDQRHALNLDLRDTLEAILRHGGASGEIPPETLAELTRYTKLFWINTGPYNFLTARKSILKITPEQLADAARAAERQGAEFPLAQGETLDQLLARLGPMLFDPSVDKFVTNKTPADGLDIITGSANNLYQNVTLRELDTFDEQFDLNSRVVKRNGTIAEEVYRVGGRYHEPLSRVVEHLEAALPHAPESTARALQALMAFYRTGTVQDRRAYDIAWVADQDSSVDTINGFIEVYMDARGRKGAWEAIVFYVNPEKTEQVRAIADHAQWFEDRMPWDPKYRKPTVTGVTVRAIDVVVETGEAGPLTAIGINLPNDQDVRERYGSKSVSLANVLHAYDRATPSSMRTEFCWSPEEIARADKWATFANELATNLHEVIGHGSGLVAERMNGTPQAFLKEHYSSIEETRADLVALYFIADPKMVELGLIPADAQQDVILAEYEGYSRTALVQLRRVREGTHIHEDHMRNRQAIVLWLIENTHAIERRIRDNKTYYVMVDANAFRDGVRRLLSEIQRIKAEGDYEAAAAFLERYGIHFDPSLRDEIVARTDALDLPAYTALVQPKLEPVRNESGEIVDVQISYPRDLTAQMFEYSERYSYSRHQPAQVAVVAR